MRQLGRVVCVIFIAAALSSAADDKPTSLLDAQAAIEANLRTPEGKAFDDQMGHDFVEKHLAPLRQCKQSVGGDFTNFWMLLKLDKDGQATGWAST